MMGAMARVRSLLPSALLASLVWPVAAGVQAQQAAPSPAAAMVDIYRCTDRTGHLTLQDAPCASGQRQEVVQMLRPQDPPPSARPQPPPPPPAPAPAPRVEVVYRQPPQPMYQCTTPEGETYTSDTGQGRARVVPVWGIGYPATGGGPRPPPGHPVGGGPPPGGRPVRSGIYATGSTVVYDPCQPLPQAEVCARLRDRSWEISRRYNSALQSERQAMDVEQRGIDARIAQDCTAP